MAQGRNAWRNRLLVLLAMVTYAVLLAAEIAPNPFPGIWDWLSEDRPLAPDLAWQERLGSRPSGAAAAGDMIAVSAGGGAQIRDRGDGDLVAPAPGPGGGEAKDDDQDETWDADWLLVAGEGNRAVVVTSRGGGEGYQVRDPDTGDVVYEDEQAVAVWGFQEARLDLRCRDRACRISAYRPGGSEPVWSTDLPGQRRGMLGANPDLASPRTPDPNRIESGVAGPEPAPRLLGFPVTRDGGDAVVVLDVTSGQILQVRQQRKGERVIVAGDRVIGSVKSRHGGVCVSEVTGYDPATGEPAWGPEPYHLWSNDGVGCEQRTPPVGGGAALTAVGQDGRPLVIDAYDGRVLWRGELDERVEGLSPERAVVRATDENTRFGVRLGGDGERLWERIADPDAGVTLAACGVVVADRDPNRVYVWDEVTGEPRLSIPTSAQVLACAPDGVLIADGRSIGFARFEDAPVPAPADPPAGDPDDPDAPLEYK